MNKVLNIALKAHKILGCRGVTRSDFKFYNNKFYLLELNTQPGMTKLSLVPEIAAFLGTTYNEGNVMFAVAAVVSATVPLFILVMFFQRQIVSGLTAGAVKG